MSATFVCPHCGASYPRKPVLVGRAVRCTTCKNAFRLREDGIADAIDMPGVPAPASDPPPPTPAPPPPVPPPRPATPAAPAPSPAPAPRSAAPARPIIPLSLPPGLADAPKAKTAAPVGAAFAIDDQIEVVEVTPEQLARPAAAAAPAKPAKAGARGGESARRPADKITTEQQEARRAMAATLATSMSAALQAETLKEEVQSAKTSASTEGRVGKIGPAILTGEGVRTAALRRTWWLIAIALCAVLGGCSWLVLHRSPARAAIDFYSSAVEGQRNRTDRITAIQERAWLIALPPANIGVPAMSDLSDARIAAPRTIKMAPLKPLFAEIKDMVLSTRVPLWMPKAVQAELEARIEEGMSEQKATATLLKANKGAVDFGDWKRRLRDTGCGDEGVEAIEYLLRGRTKANGENIYAKRLLSGDLPLAIVLTPFYGRKGGLWVNRGQSYTLRTVEYHGTLLQFSGPGWPTELRVLSITTTMLPGQ